MTKILGTLGLKSREARVLEGTPEEVKRKQWELVREQRVEAARRQKKWTEIEKVDLVWRRPYYVHASTDALFTPYRGAAFESGSAWVVADLLELYFYVRDGEVVLFEKVPSPATYTEFLERRAERERRRNAPKPRPAWMD
jgi:hypothetical protein